MSDKGMFVWHELMTRDTEKAKSFYKNVVNWGSTPWGDEESDHPYIMFLRDGNPEAPAAGMIRMEEPEFPAQLPSHFMGYIGSDDVDATAEQIKELGGTVIHGPADIPNVGRFLVASDPQGAAFSVFRFNEQHPAQPPQPGNVTWNELTTTDFEAGFDFYQKLFGWEIDQDMDMGNGWIYRLFKANGGDYPLGGMFNKTPEMPAPPNWGYYILVPDLNDALDAVKANGGQVVNGPMEVPGGDMIAQCLDSEGTYFALTQRGGGNNGEG